MAYDVGERGLNKLPKFETGPGTMSMSEIADERAIAKELWESQKDLKEGEKRLVGRRLSE